MGKLIVNEQDVRRIVDESTTNETGIINQFVNQEIKAQVNKLHLDLNNKTREYDEGVVKINNAIADLLERIAILENQKIDNSEVNITNNTELNKLEVGDILDFKTLCKEVNIPGFSRTNIKFYLFEHGIYDMRINEYRNTYFIKPKFDEKTDSELVKFIHVSKKKITFSKDIIDYFKENEKEVKESISRYIRKEKEYRFARKNVSIKMVQNYKEEVSRICGFDSPDKWTPLYKEFSKSIPNFYNDFEKARTEYREKCPNAKYDLSKLKYVVEYMQQGNLLLKIACQLYVK